MPWYPQAVARFHKWILLMWPCDSSTDPLLGSSSCGFYDSRRVRQAGICVIQLRVGVPPPFQTSSWMGTLWKTTLGRLLSITSISHPKENPFFCHQWKCKPLSTPTMRSSLFSVSSVFLGLCHRLDSVSPTSENIYPSLQGFLLALGSRGDNPILPKLMKGERKDDNCHHFSRSLWSNFLHVNFSYTLRLGVGLILASPNPQSVGGPCILI